ncbi:MAG: lysophospholipid acyltransferase family protein [Sphingomonadaceae bacterium]
MLDESFPQGTFCMIYLRNLAFLAGFWIVTIVFVLLSVVLLPLPARAMQRLAQIWSRWHRWCVIHLLGIRVQVLGDLPDYPVLYAIRHESFFEALDCPVWLDMPVPFAKAELFKIPLWGRAASIYGMVPVDRAGGARTLRMMIASARRFSSQGRPLVIFPEGTRVPHGQQYPLQSGFAGLYKMLDLPVVPVAVDSGATYGKRLKPRGTITYCLGAPVSPGLSRSEMEQRVLVAINALNPSA